MNQQDLVALAHDFLSTVFSKVALSKIRRVVLFGSVARNEFDKDSDLDLFIDSIEHIEPEISSALRSFNAARRRVWDLKGVTIPVKVTTGVLEKPAWENLRMELGDHGIVLHSRFSTAPVLKEHILVNYSMDNLTQPVKMRLLRRLYGYTIKKDGKTYPQQGIVSKEGGLRIGQNVFIIPIGSKKKIEAVLQETKSKYQMRKISF